MQTAIVAGGGIAGLASGLALARRGWRVTVLEQAGGGEVGAGVAIPANGITALHALGLDQAAVDTLGTKTVGTGFQDLHGRWILRIPDERPDVAEVVAVWGVHRQRLHAVLLRAAQDAGATLLTGRRVVAVAPGSADGERAVVRADGPEGALEADLVVGADGMWSAVRRALHPSVVPAYGGSTSWRAVVEDTTSDDRLIEMWGPGAEFGAMRISPDQVYWYGYVRHARSARFDDELVAVRERFDGWADPVSSLIDATDPARLMRHDVFHLAGGLPSYVRGRVVLVGDAAHAGLPTMGQGAATALEDAATLGRLVDPGNLRDALVAFDADRRPRCRSIARQAATMARIGAGLGDGWRQSVRNTLVRAVPGGALARSGARLVAWEPPSQR
ncbi:FAD-dependent monooxygenase [Cellulomonas sp. McL0617]|uniref:FAD-dependent monooxygenase n=1 Tax=Cellulomonas sp. McL0617 TaxID=3415675 RepID=UPI003CE93B0C